MKSKTAHSIRIKIYESLAFNTVSFSSDKFRAIVSMGLNQSSSTLALFSFRTDSCFFGRGSSEQHS